jgi:hypothetical protein
MVNCSYRIFVAENFTTFHNWSHWKPFEIFIWCLIRSNRLKPLSKWNWIKWKSLRKNSWQKKSTKNKMERFWPRFENFYFEIKSGTASNRMKTEEKRRSKTWKMGRSFMLNKNRQFSPGWRRGAVVIAFAWGV